MSIEAIELSFAYDPDRPVLRSLTFDVQPGELCVLVGPSGSGKSTVLQLLAGLHRPDRGSVRVFGRDPATKTKHEKEKGQVVAAMVLQHPERQFFNETVGDEIAFSLRRNGLSRAEIQERVEAALTAVGCPPPQYLDRSPFRLSGGEQRAVALAIALALSPKALLLDEPTAGLDPATGQHLLNHLDAWRRKHQAAVVLVSHDMAHVSRRADRVLALKDGRSAFFGTPREFFARPDLVRELGLEEPAVPRLMRLLRERGIDAPYPLFEIDEAAAAVARLAQNRVPDDPGRHDDLKRNGGPT